MKRHGSTAICKLRGRYIIDSGSKSRRDTVLSIFKALASISVFILFILGCWFIISSFVVWAAVGFGREDWQMVAVFDALGVGSITLSVVVMKLRESLESSSSY